ncbi:MAG: ABC transporter ATP-binding protein [Candidatus Nanopelagicales bacterium]|jgi:branched-chain amino acid transport system ATP-binding protein|nr:ABC transporter ATP-binding protein [Candidatus Nanopelagicales bacterium]
MLKLKGIEAGYGSLHILHGIDLEVNSGEIVAILGANGAGKTTTLRAISGLIGTRKGSMVFNGEDVTGTRSDLMVALGVVQVAEARELFGTLTVEENLSMGAWTTPRNERADTEAFVLDLFPILKERRRQAAETMSGGQQQMLAIGRALMSQPQLLMLDEPSIGLAPKLVSLVLESVQRIRDTGTTILIVEQNAAATLALSDRAYIMENGKIAFEGQGTHLLDDERVRQAYLGM